MAFDPLPHDESWWERELLRNQKLMDHYHAVFESDFSEPQDITEIWRFETDAEGNDPPAFWNASAESDSFPPPPPDLPLDFEQEDDDQYDQIKDEARSFGVRTLKLRRIPDEFEVLRLSGARVGANLAGGHGLGYQPETICGNIVKCRWALGDCDFCTEIFEYLYKRTQEEEYLDLMKQSLNLAESIKARIAHLRARSPWS